MRCRSLMMLIVLSLSVVTGCGSESQSFSFDRDSVAKATFWGSDRHYVELSDTEINKLAGILDHARLFNGPYPFDLRGKITLESEDGSKRELDVTGNGNVFYDHTAEAAYELKWKKFEEFIAELSMTEVNDFEQGIRIVFPPGADPDEQAVIQLVIKTMEAMINKDKDAFRANLESPDTDYLDFLIESPRRYRFTELELIEPFDESTGRKNIRIRFEYEEDGVVTESGYTFTSRKDKEGHWRIANID